MINFYNEYKMEKENTRNLNRVQDSFQIVGMIQVEVEPELLYITIVYN